MRRASQQRTALAPTTLSTPSAQSSPKPVAPGLPISNSGTAQRNIVGGSPAPAEQPATEIRLTPAGTFVTENVGAAKADGQAERQRQLAIVIRQRIESRLVGRVRELAVRVKGNTIVLEGKCSTYYTKQLAQHAALGVLEDEHLENAIVVEVRR